MDLLRASEMGTFIYITANKEDYYDKELGPSDADIQQDLAGITDGPTRSSIFSTSTASTISTRDILIRFVGETIQKEKLPGTARSRRRRDQQLRRLPPPAQGSVPQQPRKTGCSVNSPGTWTRATRTLFADPYG
ncbi:MAG: hypothetical protein R2857_08795 [Vampirovibrionales bacterium]